MAWDTDRRPDVLYPQENRRPSSFRPLRGRVVPSQPERAFGGATGPNLTSGACVSFVDDRMFRGTQAGVARAKAVCRPCPVRTVCLKAAIDRQEPHGVWGGLTPAERRSLTSYGPERSLELEAS